MKRRRISRTTAVELGVGLVLAVGALAYWSPPVAALVLGAVLFAGGLMDLYG